MTSKEYVETNSNLKRKIKSLIWFKIYGILKSAKVLNIVPKWREIQIQISLSFEPIKPFELVGHLLLLKGRRNSRSPETMFSCADIGLEMDEIWSVFAANNNGGWASLAPLLDRTHLS